MVGFEYETENQIWEEGEMRSVGVKEIKEKPERLR